MTEDDEQRAGAAAAATSEADATDVEPKPTPPKLKKTEPELPKASPDEPGAAPPPEPDEPSAGRRSKAERLEARAARLREAEERRAEQRRAAELAPGRDVGAAGSRSTGWIVAASVLGVVLVAALTLLVIGYFSWQHKRDLESARAQVLKVAKQDAIDFGSYDYQHLDADFKKAAAELTTSFATKSYTPQSDKLKPAIVKYHGKAVATVPDLGASSVGTAKATVVVLLDQAVTTSQSTTSRLDRNRLVMHLVKQHGRWLVSNLSTV
jgi:Mce-associated membrane protein